MQFQPGHYLAFKISDKSRAELLATFGPSFSKVIAHHVTIAFNVKDQKHLNSLVKKHCQGMVVVYGHAFDEGIEALAVSVNGQKDREDGSFYHVTLSLNAPRKPVDSNTLRDKVLPVLDCLVLDGEFTLLPK